MKKVFVDFKGNVILKDINDPCIETQGFIVKTSFCLISSGTELTAIENAKLENFSLISIAKNFLKSKKFRKRLLKELKDKTLKKSLFFYKSISKKHSYKNFEKSTIDLLPLGNASSGLVLKSNVESYKKNDRVACAGSNHAELIYSPKNLTCKIPDNISLEEAAFATLGAIALHGIHRANITQGEFIGVIGTGLIGLILVQLAKLNGAFVIAFDLINKRLNLAKKLGADLIINPLNHNSIIKVNELTNGKGLDSIIISASSKSSKPLSHAVDLIRDKGRIILLGDFPIDIDRSRLYYKEVDLLISRSYGPGRYDPYYEYKGFDYPEEYIPWTEQRNMEFFLKLISEKKIDVKPLISEIYPVEKVNLAYKELMKNPINYIAVLLDFTKTKSQSYINKKKIISKSAKNKLNIGLIGCGEFAQKMHLPYILSNPNCKIKGICTEHRKTANLCKEKFHPDYITTNYKDILKDPNINTVFIYTRHNTHEKFTIEALKAGKNVYVEKPMAITIEQCLNIRKAVKNSNNIYIIGFNRRYSPFIKITKNLLEKRNNPIIINYRIASTYLIGNHWVFDLNIGGGPIIGELCHFTDLILYLINSKPIELIARGGHLSHKNLTTHDSCSIIIKFENGSIANLIYTDLNGPNMPKERLEIFSGESAIIIDDFLKMKTSGFDFGNKILNEQDKGHKNEMNNVIRVNLGIEKPLVSVDDAIKAMDLCFKTIESIKTNNTILINSDLYE